MSRRSVLALVLVVEKNLASTGHLSFPHRSFDPLQKAHLEDLVDTPSSDNISSNMAELSTIADDLENCERSIQDVSTTPALIRSAATALKVLQMAVVKLDIRTKRSYPQRGVEASSIGGTRNS